MTACSSSGVFQQHGPITTEKRWAAPKIGCFILREELLETDKHGKFVLSNIRTLMDVRIGEHDPSLARLLCLFGGVKGRARGSRCGWHRARRISAWTDSFDWNR